MILTDAAIKNRTTIMVLIALIVFAGTFAYVTLPRESTPDIKAPFILITTVEKGVSPEDIENNITKEIEKELAGIKGLKEMLSTSSLGVSRISAEFLPDIDIEDALRRVKDKVDIAKAELPQRADEPVVSEINLAEFPIMLVSISGPISPVRLKEIAEEMEKQIESIDGVLRVDVLGALEPEIRIEFDRDRLPAYSSTLADLVKLIPSENISRSAGELETKGMKFSVRVPAEFKRPEEVRRLPLSVQDGKQIFLRDLASTRYTYKDRDSYSRLDGADSITLAIRKRVGANIITIARTVHVVIEEASKAVPLGVKIEATTDESKRIHMMINDLENNILTALLLVVGVLMLFMGLRSSMIVAMAIPLSMLVSFAVLQALGYTLNMIILFSLILSLGMLVDNAIVIVENIYRYSEMGHSRIEAAIMGTREVAWPVITSTATTVAAFSPLLFWPGIMGDFMGYLPTGVIIVLISSLFVALVISPVICTVLTPKVRKTKTDQRSWFVLGYRALLTKALHHPGTTVALAGIMLVAILMIYSRLGRGTEFFPSRDPDQAIVNIRAPQGANIHATDALAQVVAERVENHRFNPTDGHTQIDHIVTNVGSTGGSNFGALAGGSHVANLTIVFPDFEVRKTKSTEVIERIRADVAGLPGAEIKVEKMRRGPPTGAPVTVRIIGEDLPTLARISNKVKRLIETVPNLVNLRSDIEAAKPELQFKVDRERAQKLGVNTAFVADFLQMAIFGKKVGTFRQFNDEYDITIRLPQSQRSSIEDLMSLRIPNSFGQVVALSSLGRFEYRPGLGDIYRVDQNRVVTLTADVQGRLGPAVLRDVMARLDELGYSPLVASDVQDWPALCSRLVEASEHDQPSPAGRVWKMLGGRGMSRYKAQKKIRRIAESGQVDDGPINDIVEAFNRIIANPRLYNERAFEGADLPDEAQQLLAAGPQELPEKKLKRLNRLLIGTALANLIAESGRLELPPGYQLRYAGEKEESDKAAKFLFARALPIALLIIVMILVLQFNTLSAPLIIMTTVALSTIGVFVGLLVLDKPFGIIMTGVGVISLAGVVVNNAIVLLDYTRRLQARGLDVFEAALQAGVTRLRPVLLTATTTILGLLPMVTGVSFDFHVMKLATKSESSQWWSSMASAVIFGLGFATILTLIVVPALYILLYRAAAHFGLGGLRKRDQAPAVELSDY